VLAAARRSAPAPAPLEAAPPTAATRPPMRDLSGTVERDRRAGIERVIELGRWLILIFAAVTANFSSSLSVRTGEVNLLLGSWALFNLAVTLALVARHLPGKRTQYAMTGLDIAVATALVYLTGGFGSSFSLTFYVVVIASSLRFGIKGSLACATIISISYIWAGMWTAKQLPSYDVFASHIFLYFVVALATGLRLLAVGLRHRPDRIALTAGTALTILGALDVGYVHPGIARMFAQGNTLDPAFHALHTLSSRSANLEAICAILVLGAFAWSRRDT